MLLNPFMDLLLNTYKYPYVTFIFFPKPAPMKQCVSHLYSFICWLIVAFIVHVRFWVWFNKYAHISKRFVVNILKKVLRIVKNSFQSYSVYIQVLRSALKNILNILNLHFQIPPYHLYFLNINIPIYQRVSIMKMAFYFETFPLYISCQLNGRAFASAITATP